MTPNSAAIWATVYLRLPSRFYDDMTQAQIAEKIGISQMHVSRLLAAALAALREAVDTGSGPHVSSSAAGPGVTPPRHKVTGCV